MLSVPQMMGANSFSSNLGMAMVGVLLHSLAQFPVFVSCLTSLVDGGIVVIRGNIGSEARRVGTCPVAPIRASVSHVEREGYASVEHLRDAVHHSLSAACLVASSPFVEPSAPELRAHLGAVGTQLAQFAELVVDIGTRAEVHRPREVIQAVLCEI